MVRILAIYGSPRRGGNTAILTDQAVEGAESAGANVERIVLRDVAISPCLEIYGCLETGRCVIQDDFQAVYDKLTACDGMIISSPVFFYAVSSHTKMLMDRCQSLWVRKYWRDKKPYGRTQYEKKALFISVGATKGKKLFDGCLLSMRFFLDALDMELWQSFLYRGLDGRGEVLGHQEYLDQCRQAGMDLARILEKGT
jgi:multimeric flavodoxin WrbA